MRAYGGQAIAVYQQENRQGVEDLLVKGRVDFIFPADYREGTALDATVRNIIRKMGIEKRKISHRTSSSPLNLQRKKFRIQRIFSSGGYFIK